MTTKYRKKTNHTWLLDSEKKVVSGTVIKLVFHMFQCLVHLVIRKKHCMLQQKCAVFHIKNICS